MTATQSCQKCKGTGMFVYPSTATWLGGIGGQMLTEDVCDRCWGSGDVANPGENLRLKLAKLRATKDREG